jgi:Zn-dependent protease
MEGWSEIATRVALWAVPLLVAVVLHEVAHGWTAYRLGDDTAARMGRLTLNPIAHVDPFGTVLLPLLLILLRSPFLFGYAKPVPVNYYNLRHPKRDMIWVALAGPLTNVLLAAASMLLLRWLLEMGREEGGADWLVQPLSAMLRNSVILNVVLAVFNAFPIPPLDGGRVLMGLLPERGAAALARIEPFGFLIVVLLLMSDLLDVVLAPAIEVLLRLLGRLL